MSRAVLILGNDTSRQLAGSWVLKAPAGTRIEFKQPRRSVPQNDAMWAALTDVARQVLWHDLRLPAEDWKLMFLDALKQEMRLVPNLNGNGFVNLGRSSSDLSREEMGDLLTLIHSFGASHGVQFNEPERAVA